MILAVALVAASRKKRSAAKHKEAAMSLPPVTMTKDDLASLMTVQAAPPPPDYSRPGISYDPAAYQYQQQTDMYAQDRAAAQQYAYQEQPSQIYQEPAPVIAAPQEAPPATEPLVAQSAPAMEPQEEAPVQTGPLFGPSKEQEEPEETVHTGPVFGPSRYQEESEEPVPEAPVAKATVVAPAFEKDLEPMGTDIFTEGVIRKAITSLPSGLPMELSTIDLDDLVTQLAAAQYYNTHEDLLLVKLGRHYYRGDPEDLGNFLRRFKG